MAKLKCITLLLFSAVFSASAMADNNVNVRDGRPCMSGVCAGDEISTLAGIKWQAAKTNFGRPIKQNDKVDVKSLLMNFAPSASDAVKAAGSYLLSNSFDGQAIPKLAKLKGFCKPLYFTGLEGHFISDGGYDTEVHINVVPGNAPSSQTLQVKRISRLYSSSGYTNAQMDELSKQLEERYRGVRRGSPNQTEPAWSFETSGVGYDRMLTLWAPMISGIQVNDQLMAYPGCGKSLKID